MLANTRDLLATQDFDKFVSAARRGSAQDATHRSLFCNWFLSDGGGLVPSIFVLNSLLRCSAGSEARIISDADVYKIGNEYQILTGFYKSRF